MSTLLLLLAMLIPQEPSSFPQPEFVMKRYPETVMPGDTIYMMIVAKNPHDRSIYIGDYHFPVQIHLKDLEGRQTLRSEKNLVSPAFAPPFASAAIFFTDIWPGASRVFVTQAINVPPLEDWDEPFWEKHLKNLETGDRKFSFCFTFNGRFPGPIGIGNQPIPFTFELPITVTQRPGNEMVLIQKWHKALADFLKSEEFQRTGVYGISAPRNIVVRNDRFSHQHFARSRNLYPGIPNVPETWQGWKELEDSLTPSTMRDEIRLTRILIQYCDTRDPKVLDELKEWFGAMNEVQRTVMTQHVRRLASMTHGNNTLLPLFQNIYHAIREHDIAMTQRDLESLQSIGLIGRTPQD